MIEVYKHSPNAVIPTRAHKTDAGWDLYALEDSSIIIGKTKLIDTGISLHIPEGFMGMIYDRSSLALRGLRVGGGVIDSGFNGPIQVIMHNMGNTDTFIESEFINNQWITKNGFYIKAGDKIAQLVIHPIDCTGLIETRYIWNSPRGNSGFGSSDK